MRPRDVAGGLLVAALGLGFLLFGRELEMGNSFRMGPGYFPTILSLLMMALGGAMIILAWRAPHEEDAFSHVPWRGVILVVGSVLFFGLTLRSLGLAPVILIVVLVCAWASCYASLPSSALLAVGIAAFCTLLFIRGLGLPLPVLGPWLSLSYWSPPAPAPAEPAPADPAPAQ
jgi:hypothetical protein